MPSLITQEDDVPQKPRPEESGAFVLFLHSGQDQPSGPDAHPDLGPDGKAGGFQPSVERQITIVLFSKLSIVGY